MGPTDRGSEGGYSKLGHCMVFEDEFLRSFSYKLSLGLRGAAEPQSGGAVATTPHLGYTMHWLFFLVP